MYSNEYRIYLAIYFEYFVKIVFRERLSLYSNFDIMTFQKVVLLLKFRHVSFRIMHVHLQFER